jgi:hypothetical protein
VFFWSSSATTDSRCSSGIPCLVLIAIDREEIRDFMVVCGGGGRGLEGIAGGSEKDGDLRAWKEFRGAVFSLGQRVAFAGI